MKKTKKTKNEKRNTWQHSLFNVASIVFFVIIISISILGSSAFLSKITGNIPVIDTLIFKLQQVVTTHCEVIFLIVFALTVVYGVILFITHGSLHFLSDDIDKANNRITDKTAKADNRIKEAKITIKNESDRISEYINASNANAKDFSSSVKDVIDEVRVTTSDIKATTTLVKEITLINCIQKNQTNRQTERGNLN